MARTGQAGNGNGAGSMTAGLFRRRADIQQESLPTAPHAIVQRRCADFFVCLIHHFNFPLRIQFPLYLGLRAAL